jgi:glycosyltransferase involved in cell wall biosynthesis
VKKNVLQFIGSFHQGGSERQAVGLTGLLRENGEYTVFAATLNREGVLLDEMEKLGFDSIPEFKLTSFYNLNFVTQVRKCAWFLRENHIDVVQTHDFYTNVFGMLAATLAKTPLKIASKRETGGMRSASQKRVEKFAFRLADAIVVNSEAVRDHLLSRSIAPGKINVIYNGLDLERLRPKTAAREAICRKLGLPETGEVRFITLVANLRHEVKNQPMFLRVANRVLQKYPGTHFILAGEGDLRPALETQAAELGISENVHFIGRCDSLAELLLISSACVLTSFAEGFSNSIIEYMAAGKPVVATKVGGAAEAIIEGETGYLVASDDDEAMAKRLVELLGDEEKSLAMGTRGKSIAEEKFSSDAQLSKVLELYGRAQK